MLFSFVELDLPHMLNDGIMAAHAQDIKHRKIVSIKRKIALTKDTERMERDQMNVLHENYTILGRRPYVVCGF